ncbi:MAG TPA: hypothetical protein VFG69_01340 [Nannocystaceae bacterium]|nr:hypothetical protein [Nannocystaceae bacterium]
MEVRFSRALRRATLVAALSQLAACPGWFGGGDDGPGGVEMGGDFEVDPSCMLDDALVVELGDGTDGFAMLADGDGPTLHFGPQGGTHMWLGVRVGNLALDRYDVVRLTVGIFDPSQCESEAPCDGPPRLMGEWVLGEVEPLDPVDEHTIEQDQLTFIVDIEGEDVVLQARVEDPCGQTGLTQRRFVAN